MNKPRTISFHRGRLPHWEVEQGVYFVTIRLYGALPRRCVTELQGLIDEMNRSEGEVKTSLQRRTFAVYENYLHASNEKAWLTEAPISEMLSESIEFLQKNGTWNVYEYVIMPNHIHLLFSLMRDSLHSTLPSFKRWTARQAHIILGLTSRHFWQNESFDHWVRSDSEFENIAEYIRQNPVKAGLVQDFTDWPHGSWNAQNNP